MWDLSGKDKNRPLNEMIDMRAHQKRMQGARRQAETERRRSEHRSLILCVAGVVAYLGYVVCALTSDGFWSNLAGLINPR
ncbi:hypothetical protein KC238_24510 [Mycobacteroides chelonae]|uniref:hypothetical protein n=1 Tax=Mycobacteroides chelonae TaxID=1774 RepID=UPI001C2C515D|nr:hypothetical protein [Mycobacteroides chelonae]MBV0920424.1 hypothetical protein [Mycobacteroides chelonae]